MSIAFDLWVHGYAIRTGLWHAGSPHTLVLDRSVWHQVVSGPWNAVTRKRLSRRLYVTLGHP